MPITDKQIWDDGDVEITDPDESDEGSGETKA